MRFYTKQHPFYCGIDLHARSMDVCIVNHDGEIVLHRNMKAAPEPLLKAVAPYRDRTVCDIYAIPETLFRPRVTIVPLIGMQYHDLAWRTDFGCAAIIERLDTADSQTNGVGVVAMRVIGVPLQPRCQ